MALTGLTDSQTDFGWFKFCLFMLQVFVVEAILLDIVDRLSHKKEKDEGHISSGVSGLDKTRSTLTHGLRTHSAAKHFS